MSRELSDKIKLEIAMNVIAGMMGIIGGFHDHYVAGGGEPMDHVVSILKEGKDISAMCR